MNARGPLFGGLSLLLFAGIALTCDGTQEVADQDEVAPAPVRESAFPPTARPDMHADLKLAHAAPRHPSDGGGRATLRLEEGEERRTVVAGSPVRLTIDYVAGPDGIQEDGFVRLTVPRFWNWSPAQTDWPEGYGYTTVETDAEGVELAAEAVPGFWVDFFVKGRALVEGERVSITYGAGPAMATADWYAEDGAQLWITVDGDGDGWGKVLADSPTVDVIAGPPGTLRLILPSTAGPGEPVTLRIALLDGLGNYGVDFEGDVELASVTEGIELPELVRLTAPDRGLKHLELVPSEDGVYRVLARVDVGEFALQALSNPMLVENDVAPIRWGDFHGHSNLSDGTGTPENFLTYARDVAGLDAVCLTDHDHWGMLFLDEHPDIWEGIQAVSNRFDDPGKFVSIVGYEWTSWLHGHRHVLYFDGQGTIHSSIDDEAETPAQLWQKLEGEQALTFAHHSAGGPIATNWDFVPPPELEPVTEVASVHGQSEALDAPYRIYSPLPGNFVRDVLDKGLRFGFIGSADSHDGHPGLADIASPSGSGVAALLTDDMTREGVYRALMERRTYATNGPRIVLRFAIDASRMGTTIAAGEEGRTHLLYARVIGTAPIAGVEVIRSGEVVATIEGEERYELVTTLDLEPLEAGEYVYVRAIQTDRGTAWSSPIYVD